MVYYTTGIARMRAYTREKASKSRKRSDFAQRTHYARECRAIALWSSTSRRRVAGDSSILWPSDVENASVSSYNIPDDELIPTEKGASHTGRPRRLGLPDRRRRALREPT